MSEPWTPGPWVVHETEYELEVWGKHGPGWYDNVAENLPNVATARLIAAAPEMAELLDDWLTAYGPNGISEIAKDTRALLSRIRGEES